MYELTKLHLSLDEPQPSLQHKEVIPDYQLHHAAVGSVETQISEKVEGVVLLGQRPIQCDSGPKLDIRQQAFAMPQRKGE